MERILIIAGALHIGGAERIAANIGIYAPKGEFEFHYLVFDGYENIYGPEIESAGGKVFSIPSPKTNYFKYCHRLASLIRKYNYSVIHSHTQFNSGINLFVAKILGVPIRIAHSHTTKTEVPVSIVQSVYEKIMRLIIRNTATHLLACGIEAGNWMFGEKAFQKKGIILHNGIDATANAYSEVNRQRIRQLYGISPNAFIIGHAGTLLPLKNQEFLIRLMPEICKIRNDSVLLLLGGGSFEERSRLEQIALDCGVSQSVYFTGAVRNVGEILSAMDAFAFPSLREGTPLALLEAQANGLPCIVSNQVPDDAFLTDLITPLPLDVPKKWITALLEASRNQTGKYNTQIIQRGYDFHDAYQMVYALYRSIATVSFSFDDGRGDNTVAADKILVPANIPFTLNITTGYLDGSCPTNQLPTNKAPMTIQDLQRFAAMPQVEVALHGDRHLNTADDILIARKKICGWLSLDAKSVFGFASPGSKMNIDEFQSEMNSGLREQIAYLRISLRITTKKTLRVVCRKAARVIHLPFLYKVAYHDTVMIECSGKVLYSVPIMGDVTVKQVLSIIRNTIKRRGALILMFHSIEPQPAKTDHWSWSESNMNTLCSAIVGFEKQGLLKTCTTMRQFDILHHRI